MSRINMKVCKSMMQKGTWKPITCSMCRLYADRYTCLNYRSYMNPVRTPIPEAEIRQEEEHSIRHDETRDFQRDAKAAEVAEC